MKEVKYKPFEYQSTSAQQDQQTADALIEAQFLHEDKQFDMLLDSEDLKFNDERLDSDFDKLEGEIIDDVI